MNNIRVLGRFTLFQEQGLMHHRGSTITEGC